MLIFSTLHDPENLRFHGPQDVAALLMLGILSGISLGLLLDRLREASQVILDPVRRRLQDRMINFKRLVETVEEDAGGRLPDSHQAYIKHELHYGKIGGDMVNIQEKYEAPLQEVISKNGLDIDILDHYLQIRHGLERNEVVRKRTKGQNQNGSGFTDEQLLGHPSGSSVGMIDQFTDNPNWDKYEVAAGIIDKMNRWSLEQKRKHQIISDEDSQETFQCLQTLGPTKRL